MRTNAFDASGYAGTNLVPRVVARDFEVRVAGRKADVLKARGAPWARRAQWLESQG